MARALVSRRRRLGSYTDLYQLSILQIRGLSEKRQGLGAFQLQPVEITLTNKVGQ